MTDSKALVDKLWNYCNVLRDDGLVRSKSPHPDSAAHAALLDRVVWSVGDDEGLAEVAS